MSSFEDALVKAKTEVCRSVSKIAAELVYAQDHQMKKYDKQIEGLEILGRTLSNMEFGPQGGAWSSTVDNHNHGSTAVDYTYRSWNINGKPEEAKSFGFKGQT